MWNRFVSVFNKAFVLKSEEIYISSTIGISVYPDDGETPEILIKNAQIAMNAAKSSGHGQYDEFFKQSYRNQLVKRCRCQMICIRL